MYRLAYTRQVPTSEQIRRTREKAHDRSGERRRKETYTRQEDERRSNLTFTVGDRGQVMDEEVRRERDRPWDIKQTSVRTRRCEGND